MKNLFVLLLFLLINSLQAQGTEEKAIFSNVNFSVLSGMSFNSSPTVGGSICLEVKANITSNINTKISVGYTKLFDKISYDIKNYKFVSFSGISKYVTRLYAVDRIKYTIIPITIGAEYFISKTKLAPFVLFEAGYNFSSAFAEGNTYDGIAGTYDTVDEIPDEYNKNASALEDGSSITLGIGAGVKYLLTETIDVNFRYVYRYNEAIINNHQFLIGFTF